MIDFKTRRAEIIALMKKNGQHHMIREPGTVWGTGPANWPAVRGIGGLYLWPNSYPEVVGGPRDHDYFATKFDSELGERIWDMPDFFDSDVGSVDEMGWYAITTFSVEDYFTLGVFHFPEMIQEGVLAVGAILHEDDRGFCSHELFFDIDQLNEQWETIQELYSEWYEKAEMEEV